MRQLTGFGTPRGLQGRAYALGDALLLALRRFWGLVSRPAALMPGNWTDPSWIRLMTPTHLHILPGLQEGSSATACSRGVVETGLVGAAGVDPPRSPYFLIL